MKNANEALCNHVAEQNPAGATQIIRRYGYRFTGRVNNAGELSRCLQDLVRREGAPALMDIAEIHPDRELIMSAGTPALEQDLNFTSMPSRAERHYAPCGCNERYMNATGADQTQTLHLASQTNIFLLGAALLLAAAIIVKR